MSALLKIIPDPALYQVVGQRLADHLAQTDYRKRFSTLQPTFRLLWESFLEVFMLYGGLTRDLSLQPPLRQILEGLHHQGFFQEEIMLREAVYILDPMDHMNNAALCETYDLADRSDESVILSRTAIALLAGMFNAPRVLHATGQRPILPAAQSPEGAALLRGHFCRSIRFELATRGGYKAYPYVVGCFRLSPWNEKMVTVVEADFISAVFASLDLRAMADKYQTMGR